VATKWLQTSHYIKHLFISQKFQGNIGAVLGKKKLLSISEQQFSALMAAK